ncbi:MAG: hypothetical protein ABI193_02670, partial [Minicystis sp.]
MIAEPSDRGALVKTLRLRELDADNRTPLFLYEEPFLEPSSYFEGLVASIRADYEILREGVHTEGVALPPFLVPEAVPRDPLPRLEQAACAIERAAFLLGEPFDGVDVALVPSRVEDGAGWRESVATLSRAPLSSRVRLSIFDRPGGPLKGTLDELGAHFHVDPDELATYLRALGQGTSKGPQAPPGVAAPPR